MLYNVIVTEIWKKIIEIAAMNYDNALDIASSMFNSGDIVLSYEDNWHTTSYEMEKQ